VLGRDLHIFVEMVPIMTKLFPGLEAPEGKNDVSVSPSEVEERILRLVRNFLSCVALDDRPLVLFLDDLQWSSAAEASVLAGLISAFRKQGSKPAIRNLLLIICYRINELKEVNMHKLAESLSQLREGGTSIKTPELQLGPLLLVHSSVLYLTFSEMSSNCLEMP